MEDLKELCDSIRYHLLCMREFDGDASWYKDNARHIDVVLEKTQKLIDIIYPEEV